MLLEIVLLLQAVNTYTVYELCEYKIILLVKLFPRLLLMFPFEIMQLLTSVFSAFSKLPPEKTEPIIAILVETFVLFPVIEISSVMKHLFIVKFVIDSLPIISNLPEIANPSI